MDESEKLPKEAKFTQKERELNTLRKVRGVALKYGDRLQSAYKSRSHQSFYEIAEEVGFTVKEIPLSSKFVNIFGKEEVITTENSVRIGQNNTLYVGVNKEGVIDIRDLAHNTAASLLGGKRVASGLSAGINPELFLEIINKSGVKKYTRTDLAKKNLLSVSPKKEVVIDSIELLEAIVFTEDIGVEQLENIPTT